MEVWKVSHRLRLLPFDFFAEKDEAERNESFYQDRLKELNKESEELENGK